MFLSGPLKDATKESAFENCVADVNIPVGEVFTSPVLKGTTGKLFVSQVYLNELKYLNLEIDFEDGMIRDYTCTNFEKEEECRKYIKENVLMNHETLPMGEFAIGTNTTAYRMARDFDIADKLPIPDRRKDRTSLCSGRYLLFPRGGHGDLITRMENRSLQEKTIFQNSMTRI